MVVLRVTFFIYTPFEAAGLPLLRIPVQDEYDADELQAMVDEVRADGAELVVCLSHNGFDVDKSTIRTQSKLEVTGQCDRLAVSGGSGR